MVELAEVNVAWTVGTAEGAARGGGDGLGEDFGDVALVVVVGMLGERLVVTTKPYKESRAEAAWLGVYPRDALMRSCATKLETPAHRLFSGCCHVAVVHLRNMCPRRAAT